MSSAYYALFHEITHGAAKALIPQGTDEEQLKFTRHVDHTSISKVCKWVLDQGQPPKERDNIYRDIFDPLKSSQDLRDLAIFFTSLQDERHRADYDHFAGFTKPQVLSLINDAKRGCEIVKAIQGTKDAEVFYMMLALVSRFPGN